MKIGTICYATSRGLGHLARSFHRHGIITDVLVMRHPSIPTNEDWYPGAPSTNLRFPDRQLLYDFCDGKEAMLFFETPFDWSLFHHCKQKGIRAYLVTMYECTPVAAPRPHKYICPSLLDLQYFPPECSIFLPLPVEYQWRLRERAVYYVHNGGYLGIRYREGIDVLIKAMSYVKSPLQLTIRVQENVSQELLQIVDSDPRVTYIARTFPYEELYASGDVAVGAQKWNGCSLPLMEARAAGMLVINTDRFPTNTWLPREPLVAPVGYVSGSSIGGPYFKFDEAIVRPEDLAARMDEWYGRDITAYSLSGKQWAEENSWEALGPKWREALAS